MAKKGFGKLVAFAAVAGATAAGISYLKKYKSFNDELEEEFHDFEGDEEDDDDLFEEEETVSIMEEEPETKDTKEPEEAAEASKEPDAEKDGKTADTRASRKYIPLNVSKDELKLAAKDMVTAAGEIAGAAKSVLKDAAVILSESAYEAAVVAKDTAQIARAKLNERAEYHRNRQQEEADAADNAAEKSAASSDDTTATPSPSSEASKPAPESEQEKAQNETAAAQFIPKEPAGTASLEADADSELEIINPENTQKTVLETEAATGGELDVEELDE